MRNCTDWFVQKHPISGENDDVVGVCITFIYTRVVVQVRVEVYSNLVTRAIHRNGLRVT